MLSKMLLSSKYNKLTLILLLLIVSKFAFASPIRFRAVWNSKPSTEITIGYQDTNPIISTTTFYWGEEDFGRNYESYENSKQFDRDVYFKGMRNMFVELKDLKPNTRYYFVVIDTNDASGKVETTSERYYFDTAPADPSERLSIIAGGDSRTSSSEHRTARQNANIIVSKLNSDAVLFGGDYTVADTVLEWQSWFDDWQLSISEDGRLTPLIVTNGNHELSANTVANMFNLDVDQEKNDRYYHTERMGGNLLQVFTLNTEDPTVEDSNQAKWLRQELSNSCAKWKIAQYHRPIRPHEIDKSEQEGQRNWSESFEKHDVQLVVECDAHLFKYTYPIKTDACNNTTGDSFVCDEGYIRDDEEGVVYIGEGGWGASLRAANDNKNWTADSGTFNQIKWIFVSEDEIEIRTIITTPSANYDATIIPTLYDTNKFEVPSNLVLHNTGLNVSGSSFELLNDVYTLTNPNEIELTTEILGNEILEENQSNTLTVKQDYESYLWSTGETTKSISVDKEGIYTVTTKNASGCIGTAEIEITQAIITPIDLLSFTAIEQDESNLLNWQVTNQINVAHFELLKSSNGIDFTVFSEVEATEKLTASYSCTDENFYPITYYQLKTVDQDGTFKMSQIIKITRNNAGGLVIYPNPANDYLSIDLANEFLLSNKGSIDIYTTNGNLVYSENWQRENILSNIEIPTNNYPNGTYIVVISSDTILEKIIKKIVIQH